jgi:predicted tellurium resistance membrane protein TerC
VPLIVAGAALIMALLTKVPALVWAGAGLLGWIAGEVIATDPVIQPKLHAFFDGPVGVKLDALFGSLGIASHFANGGHGGEVVFGIIGIIIVLVAGVIWRRRKLRDAAHPAKAA